MGEARKRSSWGWPPGNWNVSSTQLTFLCRAIEAANNFEDPTNLAVFVRGICPRKVSNEVGDGQLSSFVRKNGRLYPCLQAVNSSCYHGEWLEQNHWRCEEKLSKKLPQRIEKNKTRLFCKVPEMEGVAVVVNRIEEICNADLREKKLTLEELKVFNSDSLSCNMNGWDSPLLDLIREEVERLKNTAK